MYIYIDIHIHTCCDIHTYILVYIHIHTHIQIYLMVYCSFASYPLPIPRNKLCAPPQFACWAQISVTDGNPTFARLAAGMVGEFMPQERGTLREREPRFR